MHKYALAAWRMALWAARRARTFAMFPVTLPIDRGPEVTRRPPMLDPSRLARLITLSLAACAVSWAFAGGALARPDAVGTTPPPAVAPAYTVSGGDHSVPNPAQVDKVLAGLNRDKSGRAAQPAEGDDGNTVALILSIVAILMACGAVTLTVARTHQPVARA